MTNVCIIRVARDQHQIAWAGVTLLSSIDGRKYLPNVIHVSGKRNVVYSACKIIECKLLVYRNYQAGPACRDSA